jgi:hypothetical protein
MWSEVAEVGFDVFGPESGPDLDRLFDDESRDLLRVPLGFAGEFKRRLNASGWFEGEEVVAAGLFTQGKAQSLMSMATGWALVEVLRARRNKSLPREFCVAVTEERVVALALSAWAEGDGDGGGESVVKVKRGERGSWSRGSVRVDVEDRSPKTGQKGGMLDLAGLEQFPVNWGKGTDTAEVVELLGRV